MPPVAQLAETVVVDFEIVIDDPTIARSGCARQRANRFAAGEVCDDPRDWMPRLGREKISSSSVAIIFAATSPCISVIQGSELKADVHGAVTRHAMKLHNAVIQYSFKFEPRAVSGAQVEHVFATGVHEKGAALCGT